MTDFCEKIKKLTQKSIIWKTISPKSVVKSCVHQLINGGQTAPTYWPAS